MFVILGFSPAQVGTLPDGCAIKAQRRARTVGKYRHTTHDVANGRDGIT